MTLPTRSWRASARALALAVLLPGALAGQVTGSERGTLTQKISGTEITIDYARPSVRGRKDLVGGQIPWGEVWTPGANESTTIRFSKDVTLDGHAVPAGKYGVWMQVLEDGPWVFLLHGDTTLYHTQNPTLEEGFLTMPVEHRTGTEFVETLTFDIDSIRADHAVIELRWGLHRVSVGLGVDPGYVLTVEASEAARYEGEWTVDRSMGIPSDSVLAEWRKDVPDGQLAEFDGWIASLAQPSFLVLAYDAETRRLYGYDPSIAEQMGDDPTKPQYQLVTKAEGIFYPGLLINGELAFLDDFSLWEFEWGADGKAVRFVERNKDDEVQSVGTRVR